MTSRLPSRSTPPPFQGSASLEDGPVRVHWEPLGIPGRSWSVINRSAVLVAAIVLVGAACSGTGEEAVPSTTETTTTDATTTVPATTTTTRPAESTTTTVPPDLTQQEAFRIVFAFDPAGGDPEQLVAALVATGAHPGLGLAGMIEHGSPGVRDVVFEAMIDDPTWALPALVAMQEYGMPSGTREEPRLWPSEIKFAINETLAAAAGAAYGRLGEMMIDLNRQMVRSEVEACAPGCNWGVVWYSAPQALTEPEGTVTYVMLFEWTVRLVSDTGAGDDVPITVQRLDAWVAVEGYPADPPAFGIHEGHGGVFNGAFIADPDVTVSGWGEDGTVVRIGDRSTIVTEFAWSLVVPASGPLLITGESPDGTTRSEIVELTALPDAERILGFIVDRIDGDDGTAALVVDDAEWLTGPAATAAARADGEIGQFDQVPNDYYIRNRNDRLRTLPVADDAAIRVIDATTNRLPEVTVTLADFIRMLETGDDLWTYGAAQPATPYWFIVDPEGVVRQMQQQYIP